MAYLVHRRWDGLCYLDVLDMFCLLPKLAMKVESIAKVGKDLVAIAFFLIGCAIIGWEEVEWVNLVELLKKLKVFKDDIKNN